MHSVRMCRKSTKANPDAVYNILSLKDLNCPDCPPRSGRKGDLRPDPETQSGRIKSLIWNDLQTAVRIVTWPFLCNPDW